ncbi:MAG: hypothetical protein ABSC51_06020 [Gaiellaceae bacterium]|jgi:hypothetical protein
MNENPVVNDLSVGQGEQTLAAAWEQLLGRLPEDWSHLLVEVELPPELPYEPVALIVSPLNPARCENLPGFRFRVARDFGYGAAPQMVGRCLERLDEAGVPGRPRLLQLLADRVPIETQGPVWRFEGRSF